MIHTQISGESIFYNSDKPLRTVGEIAASDSAKAEVFKKYEIDFCCGGKRTLEDACGLAGIDVQEVERELSKVEGLTYQAAHKYSEWPLDFLADYIYNTHHRYIRENAGLLEGMAIKVATRHGAQHPELEDLANHLKLFLANMLAHLEKEEELVFPYIKKLDALKNNPTDIQLPFNASQSPIALMEEEHQASGEDMSFLRSLTQNYALPSDACTSYVLLYQKMKAFEEDLLQHIHLENNILFPKALELETQLFKKFK